MPRRVMLFVMDPANFTWFETLSVSTVHLCYPIISSYRQPVKSYRHGNLLSECGFDSYML